MNPKFKSGPKYTILIGCNSSWGQLNSSRKSPLLNSILTLIVNNNWHHKKNIIKQNICRRQSKTNVHVHQTMFPLHIQEENDKHKYIILVHVQSELIITLFGGTITMLQMLGNRKLP